MSEPKFPQVVNLSAISERVSDVLVTSRLARTGGISGNAIKGWLANGKIEALCDDIEALVLALNAISLKTGSAESSGIHIAGRWKWALQPSITK